MSRPQRLPPWPDLASLEPVFEAAQIVGLFEWDIAGGRIYPCLGMARIFGLDPATIREGAPPAAFLEALHPDDRRAFSERIGPGAAVETVYRVVPGAAPARTILDCMRVSRDARGEPDWACGALFDYPAVRSAVRTDGAHRVLRTLDRAAELAIALRRTVEDCDNRTLRTLVDMVLVEIAAALAREIKAQPDERRLH